MLSGKLYGHDNHDESKVCVCAGMQLVSRTTPTSKESGSGQIPIRLSCCMISSMGLTKSART